MGNKSVHTKSGSEQLRPCNAYFTLKQVSVTSFQENLVPKMKYIPNAMKFGT